MRRGFADGGAPFGVYSPGELADVPPNVLDKVVAGGIKGLATLPRRAIENSQHSLDTGTYDPSAPVEAAMAMTGGAGVVPAEANSLRTGLSVGRRVLDQSSKATASDQTVDALIAERMAGGRGAAIKRQKILDRDIAAGRVKPGSELTAAEQRLQDVQMARARREDASLAAEDALHDATSWSTGQVEPGQRLDSDAIRAAFTRKPELAAGGPAMKVAREVAREAGGDVHIGAIRSAVAGRTDHHPMEVPSGSYVIPADIVSSLGEGNTESGFAVLEHMFPHSHSLAKVGKAVKSGDRRAEGGMVSDSGDGVPIMAAGGEFVIAPDDIAKRWGDLENGHAALDHFIKTQRETLIKTLKGLPGPAQD